MKSQPLPPAMKRDHIVRRIESMQLLNHSETIIYSPVVMAVYLDLEYIFFSLQNTAAQTTCLKIPEGVEVAPLGNFSYSRFSKWPPRATVEI